MKQLYWNHTSTWVFSCKLGIRYIFPEHLFIRTPQQGWFDFSKNFTKLILFRPVFRLWGWLGGFFGWQGVWRVPVGEWHFKERCKSMIFIIAWNALFQGCFLRIFASEDLLSGLFVGWLEMGEILSITSNRKIKDILF